MQKIKNRMKQLKVFIKSYIYYIFVNMKKIRNDDIWLISERGNDARDNGYTFYKYIKEHHPKIKVKYVIASSSIDKNKIAKEDLVIYNSKEHYILFLTAGYLISTHIMGYSPDFRLFTRIDKYNLIKVKGKKIFLQHGIIKDYSPGLDVNNVNLDLFISGAKKEYLYLKETLHHEEKVIQLTGLSRYDYLKDISEKYNYILIMPTWRMSLFYTSKKMPFESSKYFQYWNSFLNSKELNRILEKNNLKVIFYPHIEMQKYLKFFELNNKRIIIANFDDFDVQKLLCQSKILITDYSSVFFDFAYMEKPVIYYQFDYEEYRNSHYKEGYFCYKNDGFGNVVDNENELNNCLKKIIKNNYKVEKKYLDRKKKFFEFNDSNNSKRIYEKIIALGGK